MSSFTRLEKNGLVYTNVPATVESLVEIGFSDQEARQLIVSLGQTEKDKAESTQRKITGVAFDTVISVKNDEQQPITVMCSATAEDQHGLNAVWTQYALAKMQQQPMPPVYFHFANGNKLLLTEQNIEAFKAVWLPFRMSLFPVPDAA